MPGIKTALTATSFPVYLARHLGVKVVALAGYQRSHTTAKQSNGDGSLGGLSPCASYTLHSSSCSHTNELHVRAFYVCFCHASRRTSTA